MKLQDRFRGVLVGLAVGDALGAPVRGMTLSEIITKRGKPVRDMIGGGRGNLQPGETTDNVALAQALAESLLVREGFDCDDAAGRYSEWLRSKPKDASEIVRRSLEAWQKGVTIPNGAMGAHRLAGGRSADNGTITRCAPLALRFAFDERRLIDSSRDEASITHFDQQAGTANMTLNLLLARLMRGDEPKAALEDVIARVRHAPRASLKIAEWLAALKPNADSRTLSNGDYVLETLRIAVWALLSHDSFESAVMAAVNCGGEANAQGAVAGALAGARWGYGAIPERWLEPLQNRDHLATLADQLLDQAEQRRVA